MKDIVISEKIIKRELWVLLGCFVFAVLFDIVGIIKFGKPFTEVFMTIGYEIVITVILYALLVFIRIIIRIVLKLFKRVLRDKLNTDKS